MTVKPKLLLAALLAGLTLCACGAQKQVRVGVCDAHREWAALVTRYVIVYGAPPDRSATDYDLLRVPAPGGEGIEYGAR